MESSESESVGFSGKDPQLDSEVELSSPVPNHDNDPQPSDLNHLVHAVDALDGELQNKLDLKDGDETENKDSNFEDGGGQVCDEAAAPESDKAQGCDDDDDGDGDGWNGADEGCDWIEYVNGRVSESDKVDGDVDEVDGGEVEENKDDICNGGAQKYPLRPDAEDCSFYLKTGTCKFGFNCKFNHPIRWKNQWNDWIEKKGILPLLKIVCLVGRLVLTVHHG